MNLAGRNAENKVEFTRSIIAALTGNPYFTTMGATISLLNAAANNLENAIVAIASGGSNNRALLQQRVDELDNLLTQTGNQVENVANSTAGTDPETIITSAGLSYRQRGSHAATALPDVPLNFAAVSSSIEGVVTLNWKRVKGARVYVIEQCDDVSALKEEASRVVGVPVQLPSPVIPPLASDADWHIVAIVTKSKAMLYNRASGNRLGFRVYCINPAGSSAYSPVVIVKVY